MKPIEMITQIKENGVYITDWELTVCDHESIYSSLVYDLINKKIHKASYIRSIKCVNNYDGTQDIYVTYDNNVRRVYTIPNR